MNNWVSIEEAVRLVMKERGCSRRVARRMLAGKVKENKIRTKIDAIPMPGPMLDGEQAAEAFKDDPTSVFMPLSYFIQRFDFSQNEIMGELQSGRLRARADENTMFMVELKRAVPADNFIIDGQSIIDWMTNPKTPPSLLAKVLHITGSRLS